MKKRVLLLLTVLALTASLFAVTVFAADPRSAVCEFCGGSKEWTPLNANTDTSAGGHFYLASNYVMGAKTFSGVDVCIDLNGKTLTTNRGFIVKENATINIQGAGKLVGRSRNSSSVANVNCGWVQQTGTLNMRNVTVDFEYMETRTAPPYGQFYVEGTMNLENTTVAGGQAETTGGSIGIASTGVVILDNTNVAAGIAQKGACVYNDGKLTLKGTSQVANIMMESPQADRLTFAADFTGAAELSLPQTVEANTVLATCTEGADVSGVTCANPGVDLTVSENRLVTSLGSAATVDGTSYSTVEEALLHIEEGQTLRLDRAATQIVVGKSIVLDLNGCPVADLQITSGAAVTVKDSATDDYSVADGIYGKLAVTQGDLTVADGYLQVSEEDGISFHAYKMNISGMALRSADAGLYFTTEFKGDTLAASLIDTFGVAVSISGVPDAGTLEKEGNFTAFEGNLFNGDTDATSTLIYGIISEDNGYNTNARNANFQIFGRPYIKFNDGTVLMGQTQHRSFKDQIMEINNTQENLDWLSKTQKTELLALYADFTRLLDSWQATTIAEGYLAEEAKTLKVLAISSSFGLNTTQFLADIAMAEGAENIVVARVFTGACTLKQHVNYGLNNLPKYQYSKCVNGKWTITEETTMLEGIKDEYWDVIMLQQSAAESALADTYQDYVSTLRSFVDRHKRNPDAKYIWNMTWAYQGDSKASVFADTFKGDQTAMYNSILSAVQTEILPRGDFAAIIPSGTAIQNARTSYFGDKLTKDTYHLNNLGRIIAGYTLYATIMGLEEPGFRLDDIQLTQAGGWDLPQKITLYAEDKLVIQEAVNNALNTPYQVTASQHPSQISEFSPVGKEGLDGKKIIFIGNSYTYYGKCVLEKGQTVYSQEQRDNDQGYFYQICKANGIDVDVTNFTFGAHNLQDFYSGSCAADRGHDGLDHFSYIEDFNYDYVVLQTGSVQLNYPDILRECQPIMRRFQAANPNVKIIFLVPHIDYLLTTEQFKDTYTWRSDIKKLADAGILVVDWGSLVCDIMNGDTQVPGATQEYDISSFIISQSATDGYHENMLTGYITALMTYCAITGESAQGQPWSFQEHSEFDDAAIAAYRAKYYDYDPETNFDAILDSDADMAGIQQLIDQYLAAKTYENY